MILMNFRGRICIADERIIQIKEKFNSDSHTRISRISTIGKARKPEKNLFFPGIRVSETY